MAEVKKFTFDTEFRPEGDHVSNAARARQRKVLTQEELDQMFSRARAEGMKAGQVRAAEMMASAIALLCATVRDTMAAADEQMNEIREETTKLALIVARKLATVAVESFPASEVEEALREAVHQAIGEPRIVLRAAPNVIELIQDKLADLARDSGYEGRIVAQAEANMRAGDCRIEWRGGGAERSMDALEQAITDVITRRFSQVGMKG